MEKNQQKQKFPVEDSDKDCSEDKFVWPWVGLVANIPTEVEPSGRRVGKSGSTLRDELTVKGFNPTRVQPIWDFKGHSGYALVEFAKDFKGFECAMEFERSFQSDHHGKRDCDKGIRFRDDQLYGWVAREEDYSRSDIVGKNVKKKRDLKSISQLQEEDERKMVHLVESMSESIKMKKKCKEELEKKVDETTRCLESLELHNVLLNKTYQEGIEKMQTSMQGLYDQILGGHEKSMAELEAKREMLEERAKQIEQRAYINEEEMRRSRLERELNQKAMWEQNEANEEAMKLAKKHQKEKEKLHQRIMEMEAKLNKTQELELEIEKLKGATNVMKHMVGSDGDGDIVENIARTQIELEARETALHEKMMALTQKERATNDEYQEARKEMIQLWNANEELMKGEKTRVKRMGQLNPEPFLPAVMKKFKVPRSRAEVKAMQLCSVWEANIGDGQWSPFKIEESDGTAKRVVDKNDEKLRKLKSKYGEEVHNEVVRAKLEIEEHNASGGYVIVELWNYEENRKATMGEVTDVILKIRSSLAAMKNKRKRPLFFV
ncbi:PREDICTED: protein INVOLVED IN DE NOVO 2-like [Camelina sativa]|uniref:Protein INVOLVED IN DE NOVO 2-like n=1 Tax=Camelina sativa TaxID=90675 RepID=A0ABM1QMX5_CAMSA|nr:PREDICTED: protein INVOLVED IN DE NOVO 2-like [Camelina sativa]XP_010443692.1 PREDICTED: protein INVOLVED IN DE NOVO 2-like [Camelina sativa]XP_010443693.1 PREDICTED: protein INVOLVED IN DE NOVO 2-like [Camelina sativa]XP_019088113.1 PREDICTED: protein INVOLVED IN DE NOVO 2-like [Camelina sativa]